MKSNPLTSSLMLYLNLPSDGVVKGTCPSMTVTALLPIRTLLEASATAIYPIAMALKRLLELTLAPQPIDVECAGGIHRKCESSNCGISSSGRSIV